MKFIVKTEQEHWITRLFGLNTERKRFFFSGMMFGIAIGIALGQLLK